MLTAVCVIFSRNSNKMVRLVTDNRRGDEIKAGGKLGYICVRLSMLVHTRAHEHTLQLQINECHSLGQCRNI